MGKTLTLPGLIDVHVHLRDPGQTYKEDFYSGTSAALAGGFTTVLDMPNNADPITTEVRLEEKITRAKSQIVCDTGFHFGTLADNFDEFPKVADKVIGLKVYMNVTTGNFIIDADKLVEIYRAWPPTKPILLHAEDDVSDIVMQTLKAAPTPTHICHVSSAAELQFVMRAKEAGLPITCGVTPHHLFLNDKDADRLGSYGHMKPYLKPEKDRQFLWSHLDAIDVIESDHAPHTKAEKDSDTPPFGVPGLETTLPLLLSAMAEGKLTQKQIEDWLHYNPKRIFSLPTDPTTEVQVKMDEYVLDNNDLKTKAGWSPFAGRKMAGKVNQVTLRGDIVYKDENILAKPGSGRVIKQL